MDRAAALCLYKHLLQYGKQLKYTDKNYFAERIREQFKRSRNLGGNGTAKAYKVS